VDLSDDDDGVTRRVLLEEVGIVAEGRETAGERVLEAAGADAFEVAFEILTLTSL